MELGVWVRTPESIFLKIPTEGRLVNRHGHRCHGRLKWKDKVHVEASTSIVI